MLKRNKLEVHTLDPGPDHVVRLETGPVALRQLVLGISTFHDSHAGQEETHIDWSEDELIGGDTSGDGSVGTLQVDVTLENAIPLGGSRAEDGCCRRE